MKETGSHMKRFLSFVDRRWSALLVAAAVILFALAFAPQSYESMMAREVSRVQRSLQKRQKIIEQYAIKALQSDDDWTTFSDLPDDMVIYCYHNDSLKSWTHEFPISNDDIKAYSFSYRLQYTNNRNLYSTPLAYTGVKEQYANLGSCWYVVNTQISQDFRTKIVTGILIRTEYPGTMFENTVNPHLRIKDGYTTMGINSDDSAIVYGVEGEPLFSIVSDSPSSYTPSSAPLVWVSFLLLLAAFVIPHFRYRTWRSFRLAIYALVFIRVVSAVFIVRSGNPGTIFSPIYYADNSIFNSLGNLLINSALISIGVYCLFLMRFDIYRRLASKTRGTRFAVACLFALLTVLLAVFIHFTLRSLIINSSIVLEPFRLTQLSLYSALCYISYGLLFVALLQLLQMTLLKIDKTSHFNIFSWRNITIAIAALAIYFVVTVSVTGLEKEFEINRVRTSKLAVDRDLSLELALIEIEPSILNDNYLAALTSVNALDLIKNRLIDRYFFRDISQNYNVQITVCTPDNLLDLGSGSEPVGCFPFYDDMIREHGTPLFTGSNFYFIENYDGKSKYLGVFTFYNKEDYRVARLNIQIDSRIQNTTAVSKFDNLGVKDTRNSTIPNYYSSAKYIKGRLSSHSGTFSYPVVPSEDYKEGYFLVKRNGFFHFVNKVSDEDMTIVTRPRMPVFTYIVSFSYLFIFFGIVILACTAWMRKNKLIVLPKHTLKRKITLLTTGTMIVALVCMGIGSIFFVMRLNREHIRESTESRITSVQNALSEHCRYAMLYGSVETPDFIAAVEEVSATVRCDINIFDPGGVLIYSTKPELYEQFIVGTRMDNEAFHQIRHQHATSYMAVQNIAGTNFFSIYAPLFNAEGDMVAIVNVPYLDSNEDVEEATLSTVSAIINIYLVLLIAALVVAAFLSNSMSRPLAEIKSKIDSLALPGNRNKHIKYRNTKDELGVLIQSYNKMVDDLEESTRQLAQNEREQAWKEMARQIAHEIKNPLTPMRLSIQYLMRLKDSGVSGWEEKLDKISRSLLEQIDTLTNTANEFSSFAKFFSEEVTDVDIDEVIREEAVLFDNKDNISIRYLQNVQNPVVKARRSQVSRILVNLITNSIQAIENSGQEHGHIKITLDEMKENDARYYLVSVEDNGPGVSEENQGKLFTPNFTTKTSGTGLGLAICRSILEQSQGSIEYSRSSLGGACFTVKMKA